MGKESTYIDHFYTKYQGRISIGVGYNQKMKEIFPFVYENTIGESIGIVALGIFSNGNKGVHIYHLGAFLPQQGSGSAILKELCRQADIHNIILSVSAIPMRTDDTSIENTQLNHWYGSFGFSGEGRLLRYPISVA